MITEHLLVASSLKSRDFFERVREILDFEKDLPPLAAKVLSDIGTYYDKDLDAKGVDVPLLLETIKATVPKNAIYDSVKAFIEGATNDNISPGNVLELVKIVKQQAIGQQLAVALANREPKAKVHALIDEYTKWDDPDVIKEDDEETILGGTADHVALLSATLDRKNLIKLWPKALNDRIDGGVLPGHHIIVFAQTEIGKTQFAINLMAGFAKQGKRTLYLGNEDPIKSIHTRCIMRLARLPKYRVEEDKAEATRIAKENGLDLIDLKGLSPGSWPQVNRLARQLKPDIIVIDQLRNITSRKDGTRAESLEDCANNARAVGKRHGCVMVSLTQAGNSATDKAVVEISDIDSSKVGIPAQGDLIIAIGADQQMKASGVRIINLPKNKLSGKHEFFEAHFDTTTGVVRTPGSTN